MALDLRHCPPVETAAAAIAGFSSHLVTAATGAAGAIVLFLTPAPPAPAAALVVLPQPPNTQYV